MKIWVRLHFESKVYFMYSDAETLPENKKRGGASMRGQFENSLGTVSIDSEVVATYAGSVAVECFGIVGMAAVNMKDGLVKLLKKGLSSSWYLCKD